ncbi:type 4a pilus biogenesis protein PilO [Candidatus Kuenenbacteria bacterium]|nr:type 4a pilus biogenesis protein PilO [Candidatus Kuenenbacteria bacterium]
MHKKYYLIIGTLIFIGLMLIFFVIAPAANQIKKDKLLISAEKNNLKDLLALGQNITTNQKNLNYVEKNLEALGEPFLKKGEELKFITDLERIATENGIEQEILFNNDSGEAPGGAKIVPVEIRLNGGLHNTMNYINSLEKINYYININRIRINSSGTVNYTKKAGQQTAKDGKAEEVIVEEHILSVNISAITYWK